MNIRKLVKQFIPVGLFPTVEPFGHLAEAVLFNLINGFPARNLQVIGVTGTNGKTSTAFMIHRMLQTAGYKTGLMTTVAWGVGEDIRPQIHHYTNVPTPELMQRLKHMRAAKVDWMVMEITSQALAQNRAWGVPFSVAVMTNVTHEHLDYHRTFERYIDAKRKLFRLANRNLRGLRVGVINDEDPSAMLFASDIKNPVLYGVEQGDLRATKVKLTPSGISYTAVIKEQKVVFGYAPEGQSTTSETIDEELKYRVTCRLPGSFNVSNSLAAVSVGYALGLSKETIEQGIAALEGVEGRMTRIDEGQNFDVIIDYAHTPDSFEKLFKDFKPVIKGRLIVMFGSAGRRDEAKRTVQGVLAGRYCDEVILTEEDDRDIDGLKILDEIAAGAIKAGKIQGKDLFLIHDRTEAIKFSLKRAQPGDTVLLLGKGHEKTIERQDREDPWDEIVTTQQSLHPGS